MPQRIAILRDGRATAPGRSLSPVGAAADGVDRSELAVAAYRQRAKLTAVRSAPSAACKNGNSHVLTIRFGASRRSDAKTFCDYSPCDLSMLRI